VSQRVLSEHGLELLLKLCTALVDLTLRRTLRRLDLLDEWVSHPICLMHLFEPEFVDVVGDGMLMRGHVIQSRDGRTHEHEQLWLVRPRSSAKGPPLPRFDPGKWVRRLPVEESTGRERSISEQWHERHVRLD
jgi:hypothetical protein